MINYQINSFVLSVEENGWKIEIPFEPRNVRLPLGLTGKWLSSVDPPKFIPILRGEYHSTL
jgi:hypothetical protein